MDQKINLKARAALICIGGLPGAGKTTVGFKLLDFYGAEAILIDPDQTRLEVLGRPLDDTITDADLSSETHVRTVVRMLEKTHEAIKQGKIIIIPSAFSLREKCVRILKKLL